MPTTGMTMDDFQVGNLVLKVYGLHEGREGRVIGFRENGEGKPVVVLQFTKGRTIEGGFGAYPYNLIHVEEDTEDFQLDA